MNDTKIPDGLPGETISYGYLICPVCVTRRKQQLAGPEIPGLLFRVRMTQHLVAFECAACGTLLDPFKRFPTLLGMESEGLNLKKAVELAKRLKQGFDQADREDWQGEPPPPAA